MAELPRLSIVGGLLETILNGLARPVKAEDVHGSVEMGARLGGSWRTQLSLDASTVRSRCTVWGCTG